jgi:hypothetical protein
LFSDHDDDFLAPAAMLLNRTHAGEQYVGEGERPNGRRSKRSLDNEYDSGVYTPKRKKRSYSQEYFIEIMVVADKKMAEYHGDGLYHYILTLMSIVSTLLLFLLCCYCFCRCKSVTTVWTTGVQFPAGAKKIRFLVAASRPALGPNQRPIH